MQQMTPLEITQREFRRVMRGYDPEEVRHFIESLAEDVGTLLKENAAQGERVAELEERIRTLEAQEESLRNTLVTAQRMTEEIKANAKREADLIIREAEGKAQRLAAEAQSRAAEARQELFELQRQREVFAATLRSHIQTHLDLLQRTIPRAAKDPQDQAG